MNQPGDSTLVHKEKVSIIEWMRIQMKIDYRGYSRQALQRTQQELQIEDDVWLRSAVLQLSSFG